MEDPAILGQCYDTKELEALMGSQKNLADESDTYFTGYPCNLKLPVTVSKPESNYFASFFKVKGDKTYENVAPTTRSIEEENVGSVGHNHRCIPDINSNDVDAFNVSSGQLFEVNHGSDMRISRVTAENRHSSILANKASGHRHHHVMVERKRREKLSQRFIALSAIIPGLKKTDKATVLGDAIKYVKQLQDRIKALEEQAPKKTVQLVVYVKKTEVCTDDQEDSSSIKDFTEVSPSSINSSSNKDVTETVLTTEIETRVVDRNVLIHIRCEKRKHLLLNFLAELEKL